MIGWMAHAQSILLSNLLSMFFFNCQIWRNCLFIFNYLFKVGINFLFTFIYQRHLKRNRGINYHHSFIMIFIFTRPFIIYDRSLDFDYNPYMSNFDHHHQIIVKKENYWQLKFLNMEKRKATLCTDNYTRQVCH